MNENFYTILTNIGLAKFANSQVTQSDVTFTKIAVGDGNGAYYNPTAASTSLKKEVWRGNINSIYIDPDNPNWIVIEAIIPSDTGGFTIREVGAFDDLGNLLAIGKVPETYKPALTQGSAKDLYLKIILEVTNASAVTLKIDPSVTLASRKYVDDQITLKIVPLQQSITNLSQNVSNLKEEVTQHLAEKTNPHAVTAEQVGAVSLLNFDVHLSEKASLTNVGHTQLSNAFDSTTDTLAATPYAVKQAYDRADMAFNNEAELRAEFRAFKAALTEGFTSNQFSDGLINLDGFIVNSGYYNMPITRMEV